MGSYYKDFLRTKDRSISFSGINVPHDCMNDNLKDFQKFSVRLAADKGRFCLFEDCGLGKTFQSIEWAHHVTKHTDKPVLILAPLAVVGQTIEEGIKWGYEINEPGTGPLQISNYEQLDNVNPSEYAGIVLDESSILKNYEGAIRNKLVDRFRRTPYKLCCTATPSPNDPMELGNHAEFLGVMSRQEMLATYFIHDGGDTAKWRIKRHAVDDFYRWVASWSVMFSKPSDIGFSDEGYVLPELKFIEKQIVTPIKEGKMYNDTAVSATDFHAEVRITKVDRLDEIISIVKATDDQFIIWIEQDDDGKYLRKHIPGLIEVKGSDKPSFKKDMLLGFGYNKFKRITTKTRIGAFGLNWQNCHNMAFASPDHSYEKIYQAIRRCYRFGQQHPVNIYLVIADTMESVIQSFRRKQQQHEEMQKFMSYHTKELYYDTYCKAA